MQNNVTELTQKLLRSVDTNYNVINMPDVLEVISVLERMQITKELLEATRLGKHINELRRKATTESLQKRSKELVKRWRRLLFPNSNGQLNQSPLSARPQPPDDGPLRAQKRPGSEKLDGGNAKRFRMNGMSELDFSDNSNSSFKDVVNSALAAAKPDPVILINSDSNSSFHDVKQDPVLEQQQPKKRGRKKGSKNHRNLLDEAETSFTNKMAVSRGNAKVKTTQELVASIQNRSNANSGLSLPSGSGSTRPMDNLMERAAKLTERVSIIDQKLNTNANRKNSLKKLQKGGLLESSKNDHRVIESGIVVNVANTEEDEIVVVDDVEHEVKSEPSAAKEEGGGEEAKAEVVDVPRSYSVEEALALLPPIEPVDFEEETETEPRCTCVLKESKSGGFSLDDPDSNEEEDQDRFIEDCNCQARVHLDKKYHKSDTTEERARKLNDFYLEGINGNLSIGSDKNGPELSEDGLYLNVVPNVYTDLLPKLKTTSTTTERTNFESENYKKYSISDCSKSGEQVSSSNNGPLPLPLSGNEIKEEATDEPDAAQRPPLVFREFHELIETPSFNGEFLRILPYTIID